MFIEQLSQNEIKHMVNELVDAYRLRYSYHQRYHICEINKNETGRYEIIIERYPKPSFLQTSPVIAETKCILTDFDFKREFPFNEQNFLTYDYNVIMMKKFGLTYLNELKKHIEKEKLEKQNLNEKN